MRKKKKAKAQYLAHSESSFEYSGKAKMNTAAAVALQAPADCRLLLLPSLSICRRTSRSPSLTATFHRATAAAIVGCSSSSRSKSANRVGSTIGALRKTRLLRLPGCTRGSVSLANLDEQVEVEVADGYTMTQFCDKMIDYFLHEKPQTRDWRKLLVFRDDWKKYKESFFARCQVRADNEKDPVINQKLVGLARKMKKIDDEVEKHMELLKEVQENPLDINAIVARRRKDFTGDFFRHLTIVQDTIDSLEDRDGIARLGAKCLSAVSAYDNVIEQLETLDTAQSKFDDILNSSSLDEACDKIKSLAKTKELDSSLILLINSAWAAAKDSTTMKNEVKDIMYHIYRTTNRSLKSISPPEIKILKHLLNITDPEERFSALATTFSPGDDHEVKDPNALYTTPQELHKWIKIMLDAYHLNKEETDLIEARKMSDPVVIQRLFILKETIEEEYLKQHIDKEKDKDKDEQD